MADEPVLQWRLPNGQVEVSMHQEFDVCSPDVVPGQARPRPTAPAILRGGYTGTDLKLAAAHYHLRLLERDSLVEPLVVFHFDAFLSAARSVTWVLQKECSGLAGFEAWYATVQARLKQDALARRFVEYRNASEKQGPHRPLVTFTTEQRHHLDGRVTRSQPQPRVTLGDKAIDVLGDCSRFLDTLRQIVEDGRKRGFPPATGPNPTEFGLHLFRERPDGSWVPFDPPNGSPTPDEFPSAKAHADWLRARARFIRELPPKPG